MHRSVSAPYDSSLESVDALRTDLVQAYCTKEDTMLLKIVAPTLSPERTPLVFVLDGSGSMAGAIQLLIECMKRMVQKMRVGTPICIVTFACHANVIIDTKSLNEEERIRALLALSDFVADGVTNLHAGLAKAAEFIANLPNPHDTNTLILTDGNANAGTTTRPTDLACVIPYGCQHAIMFTSQADHTFPRCVTMISDKNTAHFVADKDGLESKLLCVLSTMSKTDITICVDEAEHITLSANCVQSINFVVFPLSPTSSTWIHVKFGSDIVVMGKYCYFEGHDLTTEIIELHNCVYKTRLKMSKIVFDLQEKASEGCAKHTEWENIFSSEVTATLAEPDKLLDEFSKLSVDGDSFAVYRSLAVFAKEICNIRDDLCGCSLQAAAKNQTDSAPSYRSLECNIYGDDNTDDTPVFRSLGIKSHNDEGSEIKKRKHKCEDDRLMSRHTGSSRHTIQHRLLALKFL